MAQTQEVRGIATTTLTEDGTTSVIYHNTRVVSFDCKRITLRSGGWETVTTRTRMNQASNQYNLGYHVFQKDFDWFVDFGGVTTPFVDGMTLKRS